MPEMNETKRPFIVVPLDRLSLDNLHRGEFDDLNCHTYQFSRKRLDSVLFAGFFDLLNKKYNLFIDEYEEEDICDPILLERILFEDLPGFRSWRQAVFRDKLKECLEMAISCKTGIFFVF